jgi:uncharacterized RDD family membrane protein YckC
MPALVAGFYLMAPTILKRFLASIYELLILLAIWMLSTWIYIRIAGSADAGMQRLGLQTLLWLVTGAYFIWCWVKSGQTPATQAWKIQLVSHDGRLLTFKQATLRYLLASVFILLFGIGFLWVLIDKNRLALHDLFVGTRWLLKT